MRVYCKGCYESYRMKDTYHLLTGEFCCQICFERDEQLRKELGMRPNKLMINPDSLNERIVKVG